MDRARDLESIIVAAHALTRVAALETRNEAPAAQWRTLAILRERGPLRIGELARLSRITQPGVTRLIGGMADAGLVAREPDPDDSRAVRVAATERGEQAYAAWRVQLVEALLPRFADLSDSEWQALRTSAELLTRRMADARPADGEESSER
ncbi:MULTISPECIES: MarR family winged helix-turn-helix transcriptional regulator [unclassified Microbacterium]|uniref:MarR family winged helix-turn-helix transcriptional regulator n=1 Tax=Microbacterium TaxID=33882 RepID=UPI003BA15461